MRCNTLLVFVLAAVSAPTLAAPLGSSENSFVARNSVEARKLAARINGDAIGSLMIAPFYRGPSNPTLFGLPPTPTPTSTNSVPTQTSSSTDNAPAPIPTVANRVPIFGPPVPFVMDKIPIFQPTVQGRELHDLLIRAMNDDESGAGIWGDLWNIGTHVLTSIIGSSQPQPQPQQQQPQQDPQQQQVQQRRDLDAMYELLSRAIDDDESGAGFWTNAFKFGTKVIAPFFLGNNQPQPQPQPQPLPAPPAPVQPSPQLQPPAQQLQDPAQQPQQQTQQTQQQRRDIDIVYSLLARAVQDSDDESGASIWSTLAGFAASLFGGGNNQRRDVDAMYSLLARAAAAAANDSDDESGANFWSDFTNIAGTVASAIFGRDADGQLQRRDLVRELLKRAAEDEESGAGIIDFLSQIFL